MNTKKRILLLVYEIIAMSLLYAVLDTAGIYKYIGAGMLALVLFVYHRSEISVLEKYSYFLIPVIFYCVLGLMCVIFNGDVTLWTWKTLIFWMFPPIFAGAMGLCYIDEPTKMINLQFVGCIIAYLILKFPYIVILGYFESTFAFVFGLFILYYAWKHQWINMTIAMVLMYMANKRIAMLAVAGCLILMLIMKVLKYGRRWIFILWGLWIAAAGTYVYSICSGLFAVFCERFHIDTNTRLGVYVKVAEKLPDNYYWGQGLGYVNELLAELLDEKAYVLYYNNPHNDFLKLYAELGLIGFAVFLLSYFVVFKIAEKKFSPKVTSQLFVLIVYFMMLMTTDNVSIYILFLVPMYSICIALMSEETAGS